MVALRVSRRHAFAAAAGWMVSSGRSLAEEDETPAGPAGQGRIIALHRPLAAHLAAPDEHPLEAIAAGPDFADVCGPGLVDYLRGQLAGLGPDDAHWSAAADRHDFAGQVWRGIDRASALLGVPDRPDVLIIFSRRFDGRTDGRAIFFGVNRFGERRLRDQVALLAAHEYHHVVRARLVGFATLADAVVAEGLATACAQLADPGRPPWQYLLYSAEQYAWYTAERRAALRRTLRAAAEHDADDAGAAASACRRAFLDGGTAGPDGAPPRSGYLLGHDLIRRWLDAGIPLATLTGMPTAEIWRGPER